MRQRESMPATPGRGGLGIDAKLQQSGTLQPDDLRVLRFDNRGYPEQRIAGDWAEYQST
jgi:hypothetical protein